MTQTLEPTTTAEPSAARRRVETWLADFEAALAARDAERAAGLFATTSFWRDLIAFTWNLTTVENRDGVEDLLRNTMETTDATNFRITDGEEPDEADGVIDGVVPVRDRGRTRLGPAAAERRGRLDVPDHARRAQGPRGEPGHDPAAGRRARRPQGPGDLEGAAGRRGRRASAATASPTSLVIGGGQGGIALGARLRQLGVTISWWTGTPARATSGAAGTSRCACTTPSGTTTCPTCRSRATGRSSRRRTRSATGSRCTRGSWRSTTGAPRPPRAPPGTTRRRSGRSPSTATARRSCCTPSSSSSPSACRASRTSRRSPARTSSAASSTTARSTPGPDAYKDKKVVVIGSNNSAFDICGALWEVGADVTMVQRSSTHIVKSDTLMDIGLGDLYSERALDGRGDHVQGGHDLRLAAVPDHARVPDPALPADGRARQGLLPSAWRRRASGTTGAPTAPACS